MRASSAILEPRSSLATFTLSPERVFQTEVARQRGFALHGHSLALYADCIKKDCPYRPG
jgi:hypothetical protein